MPGIAELPPAAKLDLLAVVTERHVRRLAGQAFEALLERMHGCLEGLSKSELAQTFPDALRQTDAQCSTPPARTKVSAAALATWSGRA